jgi:hypothetical protein
VTDAQGDAHRDALALVVAVVLDDGEGAEVVADGCDLRAVVVALARLLALVSLSGEVARRVCVCGCSRLVTPRERDLAVVVGRALDGLGLRR